MTVIAYKAGIMACDSLCADIESGSTWFKGNKIYRTKAGALVGCSGSADSRTVVALVNNVKRGAQMPSAAAFGATRCESSGILIVLPDGEVWCANIVLNEEAQEWQADVCRITGMNGYGVAGCGADMAMMAMKCGKSAKEAVALTCEMNAFCRPPIYTEPLLKPVPKKLKRR